MEKHPAAEQPQDGAPQEEAGQARGWEDPLRPEPGTAGPAAQLLGGGLLSEHQAAVHPLPSALVLLVLWFFFYLQDYFSAALPSTHLGWRVMTESARERGSGPESEGREWSRTGAFVPQTGGPGHGQSHFASWR